ncbi:sodium/proton antiporter [Cymbomonas tetramitiformis]|uniref:Sodium/proton antiporter n=1 Tax=Cymbomonas tetramitiformis TaxID=36881 RepID=A0AAE0FS87_9CHLO|nr:sodium/proton antiporter [Cymbomonas tetramitiformis]|eukprot:gene13412-15848_t
MPHKASRRSLGGVARAGVQEEGEVETAVEVQNGNGTSDLDGDDSLSCETICSIEEGVLAPENYSEKQDMFRAIGVGAALSILWGILNLDFVEDHQSISMIAVFVLGYLGIIFEETVSFNKSGVGMLMAVSLWTILALGETTPGATLVDLESQLAEVSEIIFFLMGAMTIVETVDCHQGFKLVTDVITTKDNKTLLWVIGGITFFMSAILDNLTSTIVMVSLLRKLIPEPKMRQFFGAVVVIAANAGGAWTPIGDVTTTMLWINGQITATATMRDLVVPSAVSLLVPLGLITLFADEVKGESKDDTPVKVEEMAPRGRLVFSFGVGALVFVPIFKALTGLPPYLGMLAGLGALWVLTDAIHYGEDDRDNLKVPNALSRIDTQGVLFFLGILLSIGALESAGVLGQLAVFMNDNISSPELIAGTIGVVSAVIDNVPLVAATMGMYDLSAVPQDDKLWQLIAYCAGTGGSILIIGSAAGVAFMGMEKADFGWYLRKVSPWALSGYLAGMATYIAGSQISQTFAVLPAATDVVSQLPF